MVATSPAYYCTAHGINLLAPGRYDSNFTRVIFKVILQNNSWSTSCEIVLRWMPQNPTDDKSTLVQVMACAIRQQAITWVNVDPHLCCQMTSLGYNELTIWSTGRSCFNFSSYREYREQTHQPTSTQSPSARNPHPRQTTKHWPGPHLLSPTLIGQHTDIHLRWELSTDANFIPLTATRVKATPSPFRAACCLELLLMKNDQPNVMNNHQL